MLGLLESWVHLTDEVTALLPFALFFAALALATKRIAIGKSIKEASPEIRTNIAIFTVDALLLRPFIVVPLFLAVAALGIEGFAIWDHLPKIAVLFFAVLIGDYVGYWRHRLNHLPLLWPFHATHHSDRALNWFSLIREHPFERLYKMVIDTTLLIVLGFPLWAVVLNNVIRNAWGFFIHADLRWTLGPLGAVLISPSAHRWHHTRNIDNSGKNFATIFTFWDRVHGTYRSGLCQEPTGVDHHTGGYIYEMLSPFRLWRQLRGKAATGAVYPPSEA